MLTSVEAARGKNAPGDDCENARAPPALLILSDICIRVTYRGRGTSEV